MRVETFQNRTFAMSIGDIGFLIDCGDSELLVELRHRYKDFPLEGVVNFQTQIKIDEEWVGSSTIDQQLVFKNGTLHIQTGKLRGSIDIEEGDGELVVANSCPVAEIEYYLRAVFSLLAFRMGGLLLHSAGIVRHKGAYLFFGHSGSGKTTIAKFSRDYLILNDDLVLLMPREIGWTAFATPFWNPGWSGSINTSAPVKALLRLVQDQKVFIEDMDNSVAIAEMISNVPVVPLNHAYTDKLIERCEKIVDKLEVYRLHFSKDPSFWEVIEENVSGI